MGLSIFKLFNKSNVKQEIVLDGNQNEIIIKIAEDKALRIVLEAEDKAKKLLMENGPILALAESKAIKVIIEAEKQAKKIANDTNSNLTISIGIAETKAIKIINDAETKAIKLINDAETKAIQSKLNK